MPVRLVEGKLPYTGGDAITVDENKVISLNLRDENNLIIYDAQDDEIYVDLQLPDGIKPTDAFPVGVTTGRVLVADGWDKAGTIISAKTTSGDVIKLLYADEGTLWIDNGTGTFKQIYFKADVDAIIATLTAYINAELAKKQNGVVSATAPESPAQGDLWYDTTSNSMKVYDGTNWNAVGTGGGSDIIYATQAEYTALLPGAESDGKHYFIYTESTPPTPVSPSTFDDSFTGTTLDTTIWSSEQLGSEGSLTVNNGLTITCGSTLVTGADTLYQGYRIYTNATYQGTETKITAEVTFTGITGSGNMGGTFTILGHECSYGTYNGNPVIDGVTGMEYTAWHSNGYRLCKMNSAGTGGDDTPSYTMFTNGDVVKVVLDITNDKSELYVNGSLKCTYDPVLSSAKTWNSYVGQPLLTISPLFGEGNIVWNISNVKLTTE